MATYSDIFRFTRLACYAGYITQAIVNNLSPLLFLIYQSSLGITMEQVTLLITVNFGVQLFVDLVFAKLADKIGYRVCLIGAHVFAALGLAGLMFFPRILPPFAGLITATVLMAVGGGLIEVLVSPTIEACPSPNKEKQMSLLHSFYCWGSAAVVAFSTAFLAAFGSLHWSILCLIWACLPLLNAILFAFVPVPSLAGCAVCGFAVGILWPGTFSNASRALPKGGTAMFALLALAGDLGCTLGPSLVGACASALGELKLGLAFGIAFPALFVILMLLFTKKQPKTGRQLENLKP